MMMGTDNMQKNEISLQSDQVRKQTTSQREGLDAFHALREEAGKLGSTELSLDEINKEIRETRQEGKRRKC